MYPHFLCIGAQKAGTSWLYFNMKTHPDVWLPPVKEVYYFSKSSSKPIMTFFFKKAKTRRFILAKLYRFLMPGERQFKHFSWYRHYFLRPRTDEWYEKLFLPNPGQITGDITPAYARLGREKVAHIYALLPQAKIIYVLRNPIDRIWSQAAMRFSRTYVEAHYNGLHTVEEDEIMQFLDQPSSMRNSNYIKTLDIWESFYPQEQIMVTFFDQLAEDSAGFLRAIYDFLGVDSSDRYIPQRVKEKRHSREYPSMPDHITNHLASRYYEQIEQLHRRFANQYTANWLDSAKQGVKINTV